MKLASPGLFGSKKLTQSSDIFEPEILENPFEWYQQALASTPVVSVNEGKEFVVLSHSLVSQAAGDPATFSSDFSSMMGGAHGDDPKIQAIREAGLPEMALLHFADPPTHTRFRKLVNLAFSAPRVNALEDHIRGIVLRLLKNVEGKETFDFVEEFCIPLPVEVIAQPLGMEPSDVPNIKRWSNAFADRIGALASLEREIECAEEILEWQNFVLTKVHARREAPTDDLLSAIVNASLDDERQLNDAEVLALYRDLMVAGNETTTSTLAGGLMLLLQNPDQLAKVRADMSLIPMMIEEMLRYLSPVAGIWRLATCETELGGVSIPKGAMVMLRFASANRDPSVFEDPDRFDITRPNVRKHLAFGRGIHMCVGNMLSRKEMAIAFEEIIKRIDEFELDESANDFRHAPNKLLRGLNALHLRSKKTLASAS